MCYGNRIQDVPARNRGGPRPFLDPEVHTTPLSPASTGLSAQRLHTRHAIWVLHAKASPERGAGRLQLLLHLWEEEEAGVSLRAGSGERGFPDQQPLLQMRDIESWETEHWNILTFKNYFDCQWWFIVVFIQLSCFVCFMFIHSVFSVQNDCTIKADYKSIIHALVLC